MDEKLNILIIDDSPQDYSSFRTNYGKEHRIELFGVTETGIEQAKTQVWNIALVDLDYKKGYEEGLNQVLSAVLENAAKKYPVIVVTSDGRAETRNIVLQKGGNDLVFKGTMTNEILMVKIKENISKFHQAETNYSKPQVTYNIKNAMRGANTGLVTASPTILSLQKRWNALVNYLDQPVLILGETGVGKDLAARYIYEARGDKSLPFEVINLSALQENLLPSELFGHVKGAFTGADQDKEGYLEKVGKGTLFLDEIGEIDESVQVQLLRVLENRVFQRVGDTKLRKLEAQLIFATNKDLHEAIAAGNFREDFYQRISALSFTIPPLRERPEDIPLLLEYFMASFCHAKHPLKGKALSDTFTPEALQRLIHFSWPANVRELRNEIQRLVFEADVVGADQISVEMLSRRFNGNQEVSFSTSKSSNGDNQTTPSNDNFASNTSWPLKKTVAYEELKRIEKALIQEGGRKLEAAQRLGLKNDQALRYRIQKKYYEQYPELFAEFRTIRKVYGLD